jgi:hypothetical protein
MNISDSVKCEKIPSLYMAPEWRGRFLLKPAGYFFYNCRVSEVCFFIGRGFKRDTGGVFQLLGT